MKIQTIYTITTLKTVYGYRNPVHMYELGRRTVGFVCDLQMAKEMVEDNAGDIYECGYYPFCVIEETKEGLYNIGGKEYWYQWIEDGYKPIEKPESLMIVCGFGIG